MPADYQPDQCIDHYKFISLLSRSFAGSVYLAQDMHSAQEVILKFPHDDDPGSRVILERFQREEAVGVLLHHPAIQGRLYPDEKHSENYLVLEYFPGRTLRQMMKACKPDLLPVAEVLQIVLSVCEALAYAHKYGVIHRDIKPENILLLQNGDIKILDFGIALLINGPRESWASSSSLVGTPDYMAPELLAKKRGSACSDIYAVGTMLYELLCGRTPFEEKEGFSVVTPRLSDDPPDILHYKPDLPASLATITMLTIRRDKKKRYQSIEELQHDLSDPNAITPQVYRPDPPKIGGRYRQIFSAILIIVLICIAIVLFGLLVQLTTHNPPH